MLRSTTVPILAVNAIALVVVVVAGCSSHREGSGEAHPKVVALRHLLTAEQERLLAAGAARVHHSAAIEPTLEGFHSFSDSTERSSLSLTYSTRSIDKADIAVIVEVVERPAPQPAEFDDRTMVWDDEEWVDYLVWFQRHHPREAAQLDAAFERLARWIGPTIGPETQPSTMPAR